jgi:hypothetical protein
MSNPWDKSWLRAMASLISILALLASLLPVLFGLLFITSLLHYSMLTWMTFLSPMEKGSGREMIHSNNVRIYC